MQQNRSTRRTRAIVISALAIGGASWTLVKWTNEPAPATAQVAQFADGWYHFNTWDGVLLWYIDRKDQYVVKPVSLLWHNDKDLTWYYSVAKDPWSAVDELIKGGFELQKIDGRGEYLDYVSVAKKGEDVPATTFWVPVTEGSNQKTPAGIAEYFVNINTPADLGFGGNLELPSKDAICCKIRTLSVAEGCQFIIGGGGGGGGPPQPPGIFDCLLPPNAGPCDVCVNCCDFGCCGEACAPEGGEPCCGSTNPCCGISDPCCEFPNNCFCNPGDPCCDESDPCNPACGKTDPCDPKCGNPCDPACGTPCDPSCVSACDPACGRTSPCDPICGDPCGPGCGNDSPCNQLCGNPCAAGCGNDCNPACGPIDPCDPKCGNPCDPSCGVVCNDGNPCTQDLCVGGACQFPPGPDCTICGANGDEWCVAGGCTGFACGIAVGPVPGGSDSVCPGGTVDLQLTASCSPNCGAQMQVLADPQPMHADVTVSGVFPCDGMAHTGTVTVSVSPDAPTGPLNFSLVDGRGVCSSSGSVSVKQIPTILVLGMTADKVDVGAFICANNDDDNTPDPNIPGDVAGDGIADNDPAQGQVIGENDLKHFLLLKNGGVTEGTFTLSASGNAGKIRVFRRNDRTQPVTLPHQFLANSVTEFGHYYVEGVSQSLSIRDVSLIFGYDGPGGPCQDELKITVIDLDIDVDSDNSGDVGDLDAAAEDIMEMTFPGKWGWINNDDSDENEVSDNQGVDAGMINGVMDADEDIADVWVRQVDTALWPDGAQLFIETSDPELVRVFDGNFAFSTAILGPGLPASAQLPPPIPSVQDRCLGLEGIAPGTATIAVVLREASGSEICRDELLATVIGLEVKWYTWDAVAGQPGEEITEPNMPFLDDPETAQIESLSPANIGVRYFPGANDHEDLVFHKKTAVVVETSPPIPNIPVFLKALDVNDPSSDMAPVDANGTDGEDNRDAEGGLFEMSSPGSTTIDGETKSDGTFINKYFEQFTVAVQPGDNYRVAATLKESSLIGLVVIAPEQGAAPPRLQVPPDDLPVPLFSGNLSPLLTVWRQLHVEVDSMAAPEESDNSVTGTVQGVTVSGSPVGLAHIDIQDLPADFEATNQHNVGRIDISGHGSFSTDRTIVTFGDDQVRIRGAGLSIINAVGAEYVLWDDDAGSVPPFVMAGFDEPPVTLPHIPDTSLMRRVYAPAYVEPMAPDLQYYDAIIPFDRNLGTSQLFSGEVVAASNIAADLASHPTFWVVSVYSAFQGWPTKDGDPVAEGGEPGLQLGLTVWTGNVSSGSAIYLETIRDGATGNQSVMTKLEQYSVVHETGHQFFIDHHHGLGPPAGPAGDYIMTGDTGQSLFPTNMSFSPISINIIRSITHPPRGTQGIAP